MLNPKGFIKCKTESVKTQVLAIFPVFCGISGLYKTIFKLSELTLQKVK